MRLTADNAESFVDEYGDFKSFFELGLTYWRDKILHITEDDMDTAAEPAQQNQLLEKLEALKAKLTELYDSIDWEGLEMYAYISNAVRNDVWGFELYKSADGENFEPVTVDGFGDKYNYGARTLLSTDNGLYIGTANPFYGTQLFLLQNNKQPEPVKERLLGDANLDGSVDVIDAAWIERYDAKMIELSDEAIILGDVDKNGEANIIDATWIKRWEIMMEAPEGIGEPI